MILVFIPPIKLYKEVIDEYMSLKMPNFSQDQIIALLKKFIIIFLIN